MRFEYYIASRFNRSERNNMSRPAVRIAIIGIALGLAVMLISIAVIVGFKREVRNQIIGFGSHIQVMPYATYNINEEEPLSLSDELEERIKAVDGVDAVQRIASKPGILHTNEAFQGIILKGVDSTYNWNFFSRNLIEGTTLENLPDSIISGALISSTIAKSMQLNVGDKFSTYFVNNRLRARRFQVVGIYQTTFNDYDKLYIIADASNIQQLNNWQSNQYTSLELLVKDYSMLDMIVNEVYFATMGEENQESMIYRVETIETLTPQIFDWLSMLDVNAIVILVLMLAVSGFCIISGLLILILERSATIGLFKALGATNWTIRKIFLAQASYLILRGVAWGNGIGILIIIVQYLTHIIPLDPASYYVDFVPVVLPLGVWALVNISLIVAATLMLVAPSYLVTRISPSEAMRKD